MSNLARLSALCALTVLFACDGGKEQPAPAPDTAAAQPAPATAEPAAAEPTAEPSAEANAEGETAADDGDKTAAAPARDGKPAAKGDPKAKLEQEKEGKFVGDKAVDTNYAAWLQSAGRYAVGEASTVQAVLTAKGEYKCNEEYPHKFKYGAAPAGVSYPGKMARGVSRGKTRTVVSVPFTPSSAGDKTISGTFYFSVCNDESCLIKKHPMSVTVTVHDN